VSTQQKKIKRVAVSAASFVKNETLVTELRQLGVDVTLNSLGRVMSRDELIQFWRESQPDAAIVGTEIVDRDILDAAPSLRLIAKYGVGLDNIDEAALAHRGVALGWTGGVNKRAVSELVLAFALGHFRNASASIELMRKGQWVKDGGVQLSDLRVGIVGFGHVGSDLARLLQTFGSDVFCHDVLDKSREAAQLGVKQVSYDELLAIADLVTFHVPATHLTRGMFGARELEIVKATALVVNTSRGTVLALPAFS
jgi:D-3-phosphoglycerate dehydrogenase